MPNRGDRTLDVAIIRRLAPSTLILLTALLSVDAHAQGSGAEIFGATGIQPNRGVFTTLPFEQIDMASGGVVLTFVDLELPGNAGRSLRLQRTFNSKAENFQSGATQWTWGIAGQAMNVDPTSVGSISFNKFTMSDGRQILARLNDEGGSWPPAIAGTDQFWRFNRQTRQLFTPDGTVSTFDDAGRLVRTSDPFGNLVELEYGQNNALVIRQLLGPAQVREILVQLRARGVPESMSYDGRTWTFLGPDGGDEVLLPEGVRWTFEYPGTIENPVVIVNTPHGGRVRYDLRGQEFPVPNPPPGTPNSVYLSSVLQKRTVTVNGSSSEWIFSPNISAEFPAKVVEPDGTYTTFRHEFRSSLPYMPNAFVLNSRAWVLKLRTRFDANDVPLETEELFYDDLPLRGSDGAGKTVLVPVLRERRLVRDGHEYRTEFGFGIGNYADFHHPSTIVEKVDGVWVRGTSRVFDYPSGAYILGLVRKQTVNEGAQSFEIDRAFNALGFRYSETEPHSPGSSGITTTFTPDSQGNVASVRKANDKTTSFTYSFGQVATMTTPSVVTTRVINPDGTVGSETTAGRSTSYEYDGLGRVRFTRPANANQIETRYTSNTIVSLRGNSWVMTTVDGLGRPIETVNSLGVRTRIRYDADGRRTFVSLPFKTGEGEMGTSFAYDALGRVTCEDFSGGTCDDAANGKFRTRTYSGNAIAVTDEEKHVTTLTYQPFGHPDAARLTGVHDAEDNLWTYAYNVLGNLASVSVNGTEIRRWQYDNQKPHLLASETHPESGTVTYIRYDSAGVLKEKRDANLTTFVYEHDGNDRLSTVQAGNELTTITYEAGSDNRETVTGGGVSTLFRYDGEGRLSSRTDTLDGKSFVSTYIHDGNDNLLRMTYPSGRPVEYEFNNENQITSVLNANTLVPYAFGFEYHASGGVSSYRAGNNLLTQIDFYPDRYWVRTIDVGVLRLTYGYDRVGNVASIGDQRSGKNQTFTYDRVDRLRTATMAAGTPNAFTLEYAYDAHGNRQNTPGVAYDYHPGNPFRLRSMTNGPTNMEYDPNGNMFSASGVTMTYTKKNQLNSFEVGNTTVNFAYDGDEWRVKKTVNGGTPTYYLRGPNGQLLSEWQNTTPKARVKDYVYAGARLIAIVDTDSLDAR